jgi:ATP-dependent Clp protease ATP-binding subunit ClpC
MIDEPVRAQGGALGRFTRDLTADAAAGRLEPVRAREDEIARVIDILLRQGKNNPALVGPAGVGKTAIAEGLAQRIATGDVPLTLRGVKLLSVDHVGLLAGSTYRGQYEERIRSLVAETQAAPNVILFIDELHNLIGQGTAMGTAMDAANMLKPALARGDFRVIGATTDEEYERWVQGDPALERRFQKVAVRELSVENTLDVLRARKERLERHHNVLISDDALQASIALTDRYVADRRRPDKAIDALDEACAHLQAVTKYTPQTEQLIQARRRAAGRKRGAPAPARANGDGVASGDPGAGDDSIEQLARDSFSALERFGAELEAAFVGEPGRAKRPEAKPATPAPVPAPAAVEPRVAVPRTEAEIEAELTRRLDAEGIVVKGSDVARVVGLMAGAVVAWE